MQVTPRMYLIVLPMVFLAALVDAIAGGGGLISLPAYTLAGLNYDFASGNNKCSSTFGTLTATVRYYRSGRLLVKPALVAAALAAPGSWLGTRAAMALGSRVMHGFMVLAIPAVGALVLMKGRGPETSRPMTARQYPLCGLIGLVIGFYDGFFGPGTGTFLILLFTHLLGMDMDGLPILCNKHDHNCTDCPHRYEGLPRYRNLEDFIQFESFQDTKTDDDGNEVSLDVADPSQDTEGTALLAVLFDELMEYLQEKNPRYAEMVRLGKEGKSKAEIFAAVGLESSFGYKEWNRAKKLCEEFLAD